MKTAVFERPVPRVLAFAALGLLVPLIASRFVMGFAWQANDYVLAAILLLTLGGAIELIRATVPYRRRLLAFGLAIVVFMYVWAELAVGIFTHLGS